jgi:chromosomal replication initiation ATPase DnaA
MKSMQKFISDLLALPEEEMDRKIDEFEIVLNEEMAELAVTRHKLKVFGGDYAAQQLLTIVATEYSITREQLIGEGRKFADAQCVYASLLHSGLGWGVVEIGNYIYLDHSTISASMRKVQRNQSVKKVYQKLMDKYFLYEK